MSSVSHSARRTLAYPTPAPRASQLKSSGTKVGVVPSTSHDTPLPRTRKVQKLIATSDRCAFIQGCVNHHHYFYCPNLSYVFIYLFIYLFIIYSYFSWLYVCTFNLNDMWRPYKEKNMRTNVTVAGVAAAHS